MTQLSIYDLDETITRRPTFARWLVFWAARNAPWRLPLLALQGVAMLGFVGGLVGRRRLKMLGIGFVMGAGVRRDHVAREARAFVAREMRGNALAAALDAIAADRAAGRTLVLATASMDFYADALAAALGFAGCIATRSGWDDAGLRPDLAGPNCYADEKLARIEAWLADAGLARDALHVRFASDHISDLPTLEWADEAVVVNPAPALARIAAARGWRVERWR